MRLAEQLLQSKKVQDADGTAYPLDDAIDAETGALLQRLIHERPPAVTLEIGPAYGISALFICEALRDVGGRRHITMDPVQSTTWKGIGLRHLRDAGFSSIVEFREQYSQDALPQLAAAGVRVDFAFIDGTHTFDQKLVDFFFVDRLLNVGGVVAFDDCGWPSIRQVCRFIATNRRYRACGTTSGHGMPGIGRRAIERAARKSSGLRKILAPRLTEPDESLGMPTNARCIAFEKLGEHKITPAYEFRGF
jgi:predicted O-methyltransferase YrrM